MLTALKTKPKAPGHFPLGLLPSPQQLVRGGKKRTTRNSKGKMILNLGYPWHQDEAKSTLLTDSEIPVFTRNSSAVVDAIKSLSFMSLHFVHSQTPSEGHPWAIFFLFTQKTLLVGWGRTKCLSSTQKFKNWTTHRWSDWAQTHWDTWWQWQGNVLRIQAFMGWLLNKVTRFWNQALCVPLSPKAGDHRWYFLCNPINIHSTW